MDREEALHQLHRVIRKGAAVGQEGPELGESLYGAGQRRQLLGGADGPLSLSIASREAGCGGACSGDRKSRVARERLEIGGLRDTRTQRSGPRVASIQHGPARVAERRESPLEGLEQLQVIHRREVKVLEEMDDDLVPRGGDAARVQQRRGVAQREQNVVQPPTDTAGFVERTPPRLEEEAHHIGSAEEQLDAGRNGRNSALLLTALQARMDLAVVEPAHADAGNASRGDRYVTRGPEGDDGVLDRRATLQPQRRGAAAEDLVAPNLVPMRETSHCGHELSHTPRDYGRRERRYSVRAKRTDRPPSNTMSPSPPPIDSTYRQAFDRDGFVMVSGVFDDESVTHVRRFIYFTARRLLGGGAAATTQTNHLLNVDAPWESQHLDDLVRAAQRDEPDLFEAFSDTLQNGAVLTRLLSAGRTLDSVAALLDEDVDGLALSGAQLRVDVPQDPNNGYEWHQERAYYPQNPEGHRGLVMSVALQDTPPSLGALRVVPASHRQGFTFGQHDIRRDGAAEAKTLLPERLVGAQEHATDFKRGDALFTSMNTFHRAGRNEGERVRFTLLGRYHQIANDPHYVATRARLDANQLLKARAEAVHGRLF